MMDPKASAGVHSKKKFLQQRDSGSGSSSTKVNNKYPSRSSKEKDEIPNKRYLSKSWKEKKSKSAIKIRRKSFNSSYERSLSNHDLLARIRSKNDDNLFYFTDHEKSDFKESKNSTSLENEDSNSLPGTLRSKSSTPCERSMDRDSTKFPTKLSDDSEDITYTSEDLSLEIKQFEKLVQKCQETQLEDRDSTESENEHSYTPNINTTHNLISSSPNAHQYSFKARLGRFPHKGGLVTTKPTVILASGGGKNKPLPPTPPFMPYGDSISHSTDNHLPTPSPTRSERPPIPPKLRSTPRIRRPLDPPPVPRRLHSNFTKHGFMRKDTNPTVSQFENELIYSKIQHAIELFNKKWENGIQFLITEGIIQEDCKSVAHFLMKYNEQLSKIELGEILAGQNTSDVELLTEFTHFMNFESCSFDIALRAFLSKFMLPGEAQKISRVMEVFAAKYVQCNPYLFPNADAAFVLAFALIMLNTDAHSLAIQEKGRMTKAQFIINNRGTWDGADPPVALLEQLYDSIVCNEIQMKTKGDPDRKGWIKSIKASNYEQGRRWLCLIGNELRWYKNPTLGKDHEKVLGKIKLEYVMVKELGDSLAISFTLPKELSFSTFDERGKGTLQWTMDFIIICETDNSVENWARAIRQNVSFERLPNFNPNDFRKPKSKANKKTKF